MRTVEMIGSMGNPPFNRNPLYRQVADFLRREITQERQPGERLESEDKLAARFSVSLITIREALRLLAGEGLIERQHGKGTFIAEQRRDWWIAVLIERDIAHPRASFFYMRLAQEVRRLLEEEGRPVKLYIGRVRPGETSEDLTCKEFLQDLGENRISGVVSIDVAHQGSWVDNLVANGLPLVGAGAGRRGHMLDLDRLRLVNEGVQFLIDSGRTRLGLVAWEAAHDDPSSPLPSFRKLFREALAQHGLAVNEKWIRTDIHPALPGAGWDQFREIWKDSSDRPDGLLVCDDLLFRDAATAILDLNVSVPDELTVVTHANQGSGIFYPFPVEKFEVDPDMTARRLVELLQEALTSDGPADSRGYYPMQSVPALPASEPTRKRS